MIIVFGNKWKPLIKGAFVYFSIIKKVNMKLSLEELDLLVDGLDLVLSQTNKELDSMSNFKAKLEKLKLVNSLAVKLSLELESK